MRRGLKVALAFPLLCVVGSAHAEAQEGWIVDDGLGASADDESGSDGSVPAVDPVKCRWGADELHYGSGRKVSGDYVFAFVDGLRWRLLPASGEVWVRSWRICFRGEELVSSNLDWRRVVAPEPRVLAESVFDEVVRQVPVPVPELSPVGPGFVNLGMWLAVAEPEVVSVTARAGAVWATTSAALVSTTFDMGDGTVVTCDGAGDPIPASELGSVAASPECGHTYTGVNSREPFVVTITSSWRVWWVGSGGAGGELGTLDRSSTLEYDVREIQTVGG